MAYFEIFFVNNIHVNMWIEFTWYVDMLCTALEYTEVVFCLLAGQLHHRIVYPLFIKGHVGVDAGVPRLGTPDAPAHQPGQLEVVLTDPQLGPLRLLLAVVLLVLVLTKDMIYVFPNVVDERFAVSEFLNIKLSGDSQSCSLLTDFL